MNDKEYTYDIDKYTIGVDENGEDGFGVTVAKIENGEINLLGNYHGGNARCIDLLIKENQKLNKQLEDANEKIILLQASEPMLNYKKTLEENQQKEFIKYLENIIQKEQKDLDDLCDIYKAPKENNSTYKFLCSFIHRIEEILLKYKEIIGDDK